MVLLPVADDLKDCPAANVKAAVLPDISKVAPEPTVIVEDVAIEPEPERASVPALMVVAPV